MTGTSVIIISIIVVLIIAFLITMIYVNLETNKVVEANSVLVESHLSLLEKNKSQEDLLSYQKQRLNHQDEQINVQMKKMEMLLDELKELKRRLDENDDMAQLLEKTKNRSNDIKMVNEMTDEELGAWIDQRMDESQMYKNPNLNIKSIASELGLTQKRIMQLFKNDGKYKNIKEYLNEKRFLLACHLLLKEPQWTIEAVSREVGFSNRLMLHEMMKSRLGLTPSQFRQGQ